MDHVTLAKFWKPSISLEWAKLVTSDVVQHTDNGNVLYSNIIIYDF